MIRHIVSWNYKSGLSEEQNRENALKIKHDLEELMWKIDGVIECRVQIDVLPSSNRSIVLNSIFENEEALAAYQAHPEHEPINTFINSVLKDRACVDYDDSDL